MNRINPVAMLKPGRTITGVSAILLPFQSSGDIDWKAFDAHVLRTAEAGLTPAVNMDTGFINLIGEAGQFEVLARTQTILGGGPFVAGAFVDDQPGDRFNLDAYARAIHGIEQHDGMPVIFQSFGLTQQADRGIVRSYEEIARRCRCFYGFELGCMFAPFGKIYSLDVYEQAFLKNDRCLGAKHSSLNRELEWQRLALRDEVRPDFKVFTGNDLAIDMVMYGSDYLLGLSTMAPDLFAKRDKFWANNDPAFYELNDALQYLGNFAFRDPVPAYKHTAAMFLKLRGWLDCDHTHPRSPRRPESERAVLASMLKRLAIV